MNAVVCDYSEFRHKLTRALGGFNRGAFLGRHSCVQLRDIPEPEIRSPYWVKIKTRMSCISGSDVSIIYQTDGRTLSSFTTFPFVFGRENTGIIQEVGDAVKGFRPGERVVVDPALNCRARDIGPACESCESGNTSTCRNLAEGSLSPGISTGCCADTGGGWSPAFIAHESQLHKLPPEVGDDDAAMINTFGAALHAVMRNFPDDDDIVLIYGCGATGLCIVAALRALGSGCTIVAIENSRFHGETALKAGADRVLYPKELKRPLAREAADITGANCCKTIGGGEILMGGFDLVFDTVVSPFTVNEILHLAAGGSTAVLVGAATHGAIDVSPIALKNITVKGSFGCGIETYQGRKAHTFTISIDLLRRQSLTLRQFLTHKFRLIDYRQAVSANLNKAKIRAIKTAFFFDV